MDPQENLEQMSREELLLALRRLLRGPSARRESSRDAGDAERLSHELHVHQVELETQNQELREAQGALEVSRNRDADLYDFAPLAYFTFDRQGLVLEVNLTGASMLGRDRAQLLGLPFSSLVRLNDPAIFFAHLRRCEQTGAAVMTELAATISHTGPIHLQATTVPVLDAEKRCEAFRTAFTDVSERKRAEAERARALATEKSLRQRLEGIDQAWLVVSRSLVTMADKGLADVLQTIVDEARRLTGAEVGALGLGGRPPFDSWVFSGSARETAALSLLVRGGEFPGISEPHAQTMRIRDLREQPGFLGMPPGQPSVKSLLRVPVRHAERMMGSLFLANRQGEAEAEFDEEDQRAAEMLAFRVGIALELARLHEFEARERARLALIDETTRALISLGVSETEEAISRIARLAIPGLADFCLVFFIEGEALRPGGSAHRDAIQEAVVAQLQRRVRIPRDAPHNAIALVWRTLEPVLIRDYGPEMAHKALPDPAEARLLEQLAVRSLLVVPIVGQGQALGVMVLGYSESGRRYETGDLSLVKEIAFRCAMALSNARLFSQVQAAMHARENLLAVVSHDLRSPLSAISLSAEVLAGAFPHEERRSAGKKQVVAIRRAAERMNRLIEDLVTASTIEAGRFTVERRAEAVPELMQEVASMLEPLASAKSVKLECQAPTVLPKVLCDRHRILQVFSNLVGNAVKFSPPGAVVGLRVELQGQAHCFSVSDSGPGIAASEQPHLFERFWKGNGGRAGVGLGLYIAAGIVESHKGRIWVESKEGEGSTFFFTLPVAASF